MAAAPILAHLAATAAGVGMAGMEGAVADLTACELRVARARKRLEAVIADRNRPDVIHLYRRRLLLAELQLAAAREEALSPGQPARDSELP